MHASLLLADPLADQLDALTVLVNDLRGEVQQLRAENAQLRQQVCELKCDVGYWKSCHAGTVARHLKGQRELEVANSEIRQLKAERFGKKSEKNSSTDRSNELDDPANSPPSKKKAGQQPERPVPERRDYSHLPLRQQIVDVPESQKLCGCCGKPLADLGCKTAGEQLAIETVGYRKVIARTTCRKPTSASTLGAR